MNQPKPFTVEISRVNRDKSLLEAVAENGVPIRSDCGGRGLCGKCKVRIEPKENISSITETERASLDPDELAEGYRLACLVKVLGPVKIEAPLYSSDSDAPTNKLNLKGLFKVNPAIFRHVFKGPELRAQTNTRASAPIRDISTKLLQLLKNTGSLKYQPREISLLALKSLAEPGTLDNTFTVVSHGKKGVFSIKQGSKQRSLGIAMDLGTTTLAGYLCDLGSGKLLQSSTSTNPQRIFGADVISRMAYAQNGPDENKRLRDLIVTAVDCIIADNLRKEGAKADDLDKVVVVGNPTMLCFFLGINPSSMGQYPFLPVYSGEMDLWADQIGLIDYKESILHIMPVISGFLGADTVAGIIAEDMDQSESAGLFMDLGTNGELVLSARKKLWAASCATGPAFEGGGISCGIRAVPGAIHRVNIDSLNHTVNYKTLGNESIQAPLGICGSGVLEAIAGMWKLGLISSDGRMRVNPRFKYFEENQGSLRFNITESKDNRPNIYISQKDVREIQLAKAAVSTGVRLLMETAGIDEVEKIVITGALGSAIDMGHAQTIGLITKNIGDQDCKIVENAAGVGAIQCLLDEDIGARARALAKGVETVDLAGHHDFQEIFISETFFPD